MTAAVAGSPAADDVRRYRVAELAGLWEVDPSTVYRLIYAGRLRAERHGARRGAIRVPADAVADYLKAAAAEVAA